MKKCVYCDSDLPLASLFCPRCGYSVTLGFPQAVSSPTTLLPQRASSPKEVSPLPSSMKKDMDNESFSVMSQMNDVLLDLSWQFVREHSGFSAGKVMKYLVERVRPISFSFSSIKALKSFCQSELENLARSFDN